MTAPEPTPEPTLQVAPKSENEEARLAALHLYEILDTDPEIGFDDLTALAASICDVPMAAVTLVDADRQWFKSRVGMEKPETPLEHSFCSYAILRPEMLVVEDAAQHPTFSTHAAVTAPGGIRFYAGAPLITPEGFALGTICVADSVPRQLSPEQARSLQALGRQVQTQLELRRKLRDLRRANDERDLAQAQRDAQTEEVERDLRFAREFQQSLLPDNDHYPTIPDIAAAQSSEHAGAALRLNFHHIYQPALSLGGDFFDVQKLSENRAGVFIADVMGHGARSALVTAILRTLFQELAPQTTEPGELLTRLNARFHSIVDGSDQFLFVSACYLILDTQRARALYSSAGHPAPIWADAERTRVDFLEDASCTGAALGLEPDTQYPSLDIPLGAGETFLLFTDGLPEAPGPTREEFGEQRLRDIVRQNPRAHASRLTQNIVDALGEWTQGAKLPDDLCLIAVEVVGQEVVGQEVVGADARATP